MTRNRVVLTVDGGVVQAINADRPGDVDVTVLDFDVDGEPGADHPSVHRVTDANGISNLVAVGGGEPQPVGPGLAGVLAQIAEQDGEDPAPLPPPEAGVQLDLGTFSPTGPEGEEDRRRLGTLWINGVPFHVEAYRVTDAGGVQVADGGAELNAWFDEWASPAGPDGPWSTIEYDEHEWVLFLSPYC